MRMRLSGLWRDANFMKLWSSQAISSFGSQMTFLALPLTAVLVLDATPSQMGILMALEALPTLLIGLFVGVWVDHYRRRPILIMADVGRAVLLGVVPVAAILGLLRIEHLYIVCFLVSALGLFFGVAHRSFLPSLVGREHLVEANSKLELSNSMAEIVGPGAAGGLVQVVTAPIAIVVDALSYLVSAVLLGLIRVSEPEPRPAVSHNIGVEIGEGLKFVLHDRRLRAIAGCLGTLYLFNSVIEAAFILYVTQKVGLGAGWLGLIFAGGSVGFLLGAFLPGWVVRQFGWGPGMIVGLLLVGLSDLLVPVVSGSLAVVVAVAVLMAAQFFFGLGLVVFNAGQVSFRQAMTPDALQGRMNATMSFLAGAVVPLGGLLGGFLGEAIGLRPTLLLAALGEILSVLWLLLSPMRSQREQPGSAG